MKNVLVALLVLFCSAAQAQTGKIYGTVTNSINNETLPFVNIILTGTAFGGVSDLDGNYSIENIPPGLYNVEFSYVGFKKETIFEVQVSNAKPIYLSVSLKEDVSLIEAVEIKGTPTDRTEESPLSLRTIGANEIQRNPGGNRDISRVIQSLPGVTYTPSFRNDIIIRGGAPNENRFYLDGIEVPNINHFATQGSSGGPVGLINVDFIREVEFYSGAFPVNYGNALSSVFSFEQRDGRTDKWGGTFTLGSSDLGISAEGPLGDKSSVLFSARRSYLQFLFGAIGLPFLPTYNDFQYKQKIKIDQKNEITIIGLGAIDQFALNTEDDTSAYQKYILGFLPAQTQWNYTIGASYKHFRKNGYSTFVLSRNMLNNRSFKYINNDETNPDNKIFDYTSREMENKFRYEETVDVKNFRIRGGVNFELAKYTNDTYQLIALEDEVLTVDYVSDLQFQKWGAFVQSSTTLLDYRLTLSFGLRADANNYSESMQNLLDQLSPRLSASYKLTDLWSLNFNTGIYYQLPAYTVLGYADGENNFVNKANNITYIQSNHIVAGTEYRPNSYLRFTLEGFYKQYKNYPFSLRDSVSLANLGADFGVIGDEPVTSTSDGRSYGVEFLAQQKLNKNFYGILSVTYVVSEFEDKNGEYAPSSWDNRTIIALTAGKKFKKNWEAGLKWRFSGGLPYTPFDKEFSSLIYVWDINRQGLVDFDRLNEERLAPYHQLDIRIDKKWFFDEWNLDVYVDIQNVYNFQTELQPLIDVVRDVDGNFVVDPEDPSRYQIYELENVSGTLLPSIGLIIEI
jgi:outer membrane receptor for ferrienterochelin and colicin